MTRLKIRLFGQISVQQDEQPLSGLSTKALELLCYLLLHRERGHTREALAGLFWPEAPDSLSKKYLRQAIWRLHSTVATRAEPAQERRPRIGVEPRSGSRRQCSGQLHRLSDGDCCGVGTVGPDHYRGDHHAPKSSWSIRPVL